ncbi:unnamed protein product [Linum tenue]|uniref:Uncharacterized protein n=1 Tax=Linum tenue TaxID=586396 RepID=A0AAV0S134_9ROSI|nr:unnamed protein product [Linum tenue]
MNRALIALLSSLGAGEADSFHCFSSHDSFLLPIPFSYPPHSLSSSSPQPLSTIRCFASMALLNHIVVSKLAYTEKAPVLKLRLLHTWMAGNPDRPDGFYEHSIATDELEPLYYWVPDTRNPRDEPSAFRTHPVGQMEAAPSSSLCKRDCMLMKKKKGTFHHSSFLGGGATLAAACKKAGCRARSL